MLSQMRTDNAQQICIDPKWERNEQEDLKKAIDALYDFNKKLSELHPNCRIYIEKLLQQSKY